MQNARNGLLGLSVLKGCFRDPVSTTDEVFSITASEDSQFFFCISTLLPLLTNRHTTYRITYAMRASWHRARHWTLAERVERGGCSMRSSVWVATAVVLALGFSWGLSTPDPVHAQLLSQADALQAVAGATCQCSTGYSCSTICTPTQKDGTTQYVFCDGNSGAKRWCKNLPDQSNYSCSIDSKPVAIPCGQRKFCLLSNCQQCSGTDACEFYQATSTSTHCPNET